MFFLQAGPGGWGQSEHPYLSTHTLQHPWGSPLPYQVFFLSPKPTGLGRWKCFQSHRCWNEGWQLGGSGVVLHREKNTGSQGQARAWQRQCFTGNSDAGTQRWRMSQEDLPAPPHERVQHPGSAARQAGLGSQLWCLGTWGKSHSSIGLFPHLQNGIQKHLCQLGLWQMLLPSLVPCHELPLLQQSYLLSHSLLKRAMGAALCQDSRNEPGWALPSRSSKLVERSPRGPGSLGVWSQGLQKGDDSRMGAEGPPTWQHVC